MEFYSTSNCLLCLFRNQASLSNENYIDCVKREFPILTLCLESKESVATYFFICTNLENFRFCLCWVFVKSVFGLLRRKRFDIYNFPVGRNFETVTLVGTLECY